MINGIKLGNFNIKDSKDIKLRGLANIPLVKGDPGENGIMIFDLKNNENVTQEVAKEVISNYSKYEDTFINFVNKKTKAYGFLTTGTDNIEYLITFDFLGNVTKWTETTSEFINYTKQALDDIKNNLDDEINFLTGEISDAKQEIQIMDTEQTQIKASLTDIIERITILEGK